MIEQNKMKLAEVFRTERAKLRLHQKDVAERSGLSRPTIIAIENGSYEDIRYLTLCKLARFYGFSLKMELFKISVEA